MTIIHLMSVLFMISYVKPIEVQLEYHTGTAMLSDDSIDDGIRTVVSDSESLLIRQEMLFLQSSNGVIAANHTLDYQPDKMYGYKVTEENIVHVVMTIHSDKQSSINQVVHCEYYYVYERFFCPPRSNYTPPTTEFVASVHITHDDQVSVYAVYYDNGYLTRHDVIYNEQRGSDRLPQDCSSNNTRLIPMNDTNGRVIVKCESDNAYIYDVYIRKFVYLPPNVRNVATSKHGDLMLVSQPAEGMYQDLAAVTNMVTDQRNFSVLLLDNAYTNMTNPVWVIDVTVVVVNKTTQLEVGYILRNTELLYFELNELDMIKVNSLSFPPDMTPIAFRGTYNSSVIVEVTFSNGTSLLMVAEAELGNLSMDVEPNNSTLNDSDTATNTTTTMPPTSSYTTPSDDHPTKLTTRPCPTKKPTPINGNHDQEDSESTDNRSDGFVSEITVCGAFIGGVIITSAVFAIVLVMCRVCKKSRKPSDDKNAENC